MVRRSAMILAGFLTAAVMVLFALALNPAFGGPVAFGAQPFFASTAVVDETSDFYAEMAAQADEVYRQREASLQAQVAAAKRSVSDQDSAYQSEVAHLQETLADVEHSIDAAARDIDALNAMSSIAQAQMQQDEADFQQVLLQFETRDRQLQQQLDAAVLQLQAAYDEIAARQASQQSSYDSSSDDGQHDDGDARDHDDGDHQDDDHDDDDDDHDEDHDDDHDDDDHDDDHDDD